MELQDPPPCRRVGTELASAEQCILHILDLARSREEDQHLGHEYIDHAIGHAMGNAIGHEMGHAIAHAIGHAMGNAIGHAMGNAIGHEMGLAIGHAIGRAISQGGRSAPL